MKVIPDDVLWRVFGLAGIALMLQELVNAGILPQVVERLGWPTRVIIAVISIASRIFSISFAKDLCFRPRLAKAGLKSPQNENCPERSEDARSRLVLSLIILMIFSNLKPVKKGPSFSLTA
jgi:hypothetical protein